jgi:hypothetical protein
VHNYVLPVKASLANRNQMCSRKAPNQTDPVKCKQPWVVLSC